MQSLLIAYEKIIEFFYVFLHVRVAAVFCVCVCVLVSSITSKHSMRLVSPCSIVEQHTRVIVDTLVDSSGNNLTVQVEAMKFT